MIILKQIQKSGLVLALLLTAHLSHGQQVNLNGQKLTLGGSVDNCLGYYATYNAPMGTWNGINVDGPVLCGSGGGLLGTSYNGTYMAALYWNGAGNIGIGTTAPAARLHVRGAGNAMPVRSGTAQSAGLISRFQTADYLVLDLGGNSTDGIWLQSALAANLSTNYALMLNPNGGNVGVGTTAPTAKLDVAGDTRVAGALAVTGNTQISGVLSVTGAGGTFGTFVVDPLGANTGSMNTGSSSGNCLAFGSGLGTGGVGIASKGDAGGNRNGLDFYTATTNRMSITNSGNVGIGSTAPTAKLTVKTNGANALPATTGTTQATSQIARFQGIDDLVLDLGAYSTGGTWLQSTNATSLSTNYPLMLNPNGGNVGIGTTAPAAKLDVLGDTRLNGNVFIGSDMSKFTSPSTAMTDRKTTFGLWVAKGVVASDFAIATSGNWPDFVFAPGYRLAPLSETEAYIRQHGHLPEMPSAEEVKKDGYSVHELNTRLLQKIEELTLHSIEQEKQIQALTAMQAQLRQVEALAAEVARLKAAMAK